MMLKTLTTILITTTILILKTVIGYGQELVGMDYNQAIMNAEQRQFKAATTQKVDTFQFTGEFFEDFTYYATSVYPDPKKWSDRDAFVNSTFADSMISYGVATLDALDPNGLPYPGNDGQVIPSDSLTSNPFKFDVTPANQLYLSFFYEAGGKGAKPDSVDSLCVDLYAVSVQKWIEVKAIPGGTQMHNFKQEIIAINDTLVRNGFRFRFRNYTSLSSKTQVAKAPGVSNGDQWNIDYIQVKAAPSINDMENIDDVTINKTLPSSLTSYNSVPYTHLNFAVQTSERKTIPLSVRTYFPSSSAAIQVSRNYISYNVIKDSNNVIQYKKLISRGPYSNIMEPYSIYQTNDYFPPGSVYDPTKTYGELKMVAYITTDNLTENTANDTITRTDYFYNYYAYDDGSAEFGIGISGEQQTNSRLALRFAIFRRSTNPDTLKAVEIYFNKTRNWNTKDAQFQIFVRKSIKGVPADSDLYLSSKVYTPDTTLGYTQFMRIPLDKPILVADTIFVGVIQLNKYLNIGYDINDNSLPDLYVYKDSQWSHPDSLEKGTMMMRLVFDGHEAPTAIPTVHVNKPEIELYPNPTSNILYFKTQPVSNELFHVRIFDMLGRMELNVETNNHSIDVSNLSKGIHFLQLISQQGELVRTLKFVKE